MDWVWIGNSLLLGGALAMTNTDSLIYCRFNKSIFSIFEECNIVMIISQNIKGNFVIVWLKINFLTLELFHRNYRLGSNRNQEGQGRINCYSHSLQPEERTLSVGLMKLRKLFSKSCKTVSMAFYVCVWKG